MKYLSLLLATVVTIVSVSFSIHASPLASVDAQATYLSESDSDGRTGDVLGQTVSAAAFAATDDGGYADALASSSLPGAVRAYAGGVGAYGGPINAGASASQTIDWYAGSSTLPLGTPVSISLAVSFTGTLEATYGESASASASLLWGGTYLYQASGAGGYETPIGTGQWVGDFTEIPAEEVLEPSPRSWGRHVFLLDTVDTVTFNTTVGEVVTLTLSLTTGMTSGGYESGAWVDFLHSGSYMFAGAEDPISGDPLDVQFQVIPEPSACALMLITAAVTLVLRSGWRRLDV